MKDTDRFRRFILYPQAFPNGSNVLDADALFRFVEVERDNVWEMSFTSEQDVPDEGQAHVYGRSAAEKQNANFEEVEGRAPDDEKERVYYLGFYHVYRWSIVSQQLDWLSTAFYPYPEDGNAGHFAFMLFPKRIDGTSIKKRKNDMRKVRSFLRQCMMGPSRFWHGEDRSHWPNTVDLQQHEHRSLEDLKVMFTAA